ncbi:ABC transporter permease [Actinacidiphila bryophytorum]|uniref:ABC-type transport system involved in multi-copper enzyme maturation, permease component n=1 Tax=Actinacidiphila bryophytorum TaxID=1436133 RepID=A0A9W4E327_9ACTN|nr:ABC transporter permease [Actinacidiphila bryophytorum]CAG7610081.1 ABC-type transport system involved in multi-copper enzyme maturation, permease component [Actinacidiphila bryophytorum]
MSTTTSTVMAGGPVPPAAAAAPRGHVTQLRVFHSEWIKMRSLRSTFYTLIAAVVALIGLGALFSAFTASHWASMNPHERADFEPGMTSLRGFFLAQLAVGVLGVLMISGEYATGMIRASLSAVPGRLPVLWAKAGLYAAVIWVLTTAGALVAFLIGQATMSSKHIGTSLGNPGVLRQVMGVGLYLTVVGLLGVAIGALIRNTAGGIATVFGLLLVVPVLAEALPTSWSNHVNQWLPSNAGQSLISLHREAHTLAPWTGFAVFCLYAAVALAAAAVLLKRRDA